MWSGGDMLIVYRGKVTVLGMKLVQKMVTKRAAPGPKLRMEIVRMHKVREQMFINRCLYVRDKVRWKKVCKQKFICRCLGIIFGFTLFYSPVTFFTLTCLMV